MFRFTEFLSIPSLVAVSLFQLAAAVADGSTARRAFSVMERHCLSCHNDVDREGEFSLQTKQSFFESGFVEPGDAESSYLLHVVEFDGNEPPQMPQDAAPLSQADVDLFREWIAAGAPWPDGYRLTDTVVDNFDWWSLKPLERPPVPQFEHGSPEYYRIRTPIDAFIAKTLQEHDLPSAAEADEHTLIRRLSYDLTGLPPTPEEVRTFKNATGPRAFEELVDRLLASERYGERWARHWLDVVKYADTCGYDKDKLRPNAWPYRDYVIRSFNEDKPYDRFVEEQIAGDVLFPAEPDGILALGFIAAGPWDFIGHVEVPESRMDGKVARNLDRDDMVSNTLNTFCSVTIQCARCHNHKFDPFTQEHYYSLQSVFAAVDRAERPWDLSPEIQQKRFALAEELYAVKKTLQEHDRTVRKDGEPELPEAEARVVALKAAPATDEAVLAAAQARVSEILTRIVTPERKAKQEELLAVVTAVEEKLAELPEGNMIYSAATHFPPNVNFIPTKGRPRTVRVLHRGNVLQPLHEAIPGSIPLNAECDWHLPLPVEHSEGDRRAALARWITADDNPLTWRSIANRIWQHHFGKAIVTTPNDLGRMGQLPSHPDLLDWLAVEFRDNGRSFKKLHRTIVTSSTWRQASTHNPAAEKIDSGNRFLWRQNRRRLSAEELRDSVLSVSGRLSPDMGGPGYYLFELEKADHSPHYEYHKFNPDDPASHRRSIYRFIVRSQPDPFMTTLDCADSSQSTPRRTETFTPLQALALLNNGFTLAMARHFAARIETPSEDRTQQVQRAFELVTGRSAVDQELALLLQYSDRHGLSALCRLLFNLNQFIFVD